MLRRFRASRALLLCGREDLARFPRQVNSDADAKLTTGSFTALEANPKIGRAGVLQQAMTAMVKAGNDSEAHPSNWAAFILVGEGGTARQ